MITNTKLTRNLAKLMLVAVFFISFTSCKEEAQSSVQNGNFQLEFLFEQNGCKMYRFKDGGRYVYWSDCQGKTQSDYSTNTGKSNVTHHFESVTSE